MLSILDRVMLITPLWLVGIIIVIACLLAREGGIWLYQRSAAKHPGTEKTDGHDAEAYIIGAVFGLLAFVVGLTFSIAIDRYDVRRGLVREEANAISTTYLRAALFDEPHRSQLQSTLREYAHRRVANEGVWDEKMEAQVQGMLEIRRRLWDHAYAAVLPVRETDQASYFIEAMNDTLNIGTHRQLLASAHVPSRIFEVMLIYLLVSSVVLGYMVKSRKGGTRQASTVLLVLFTVVITLILDVDRPQSGSIKVSQRAMEDLVKFLNDDALRRPAAIQPIMTSPVLLPPDS